MTRKKPDTALLEQELTHEIIGSFYTVYNELGYGFLESVFANGLSLELRRRNLHVAREVPVEVQYLGQPIGRFRMDLVVDHKVLVEIKSTSTVGDADRRQVFNYLRASVLPIALLLHFGPKPDFQRFISPRLLHTTNRADRALSV